jgi:hypothetical protein
MAIPIAATVKVAMSPTVTEPSPDPAADFTPEVE